MAMKFSEDTSTHHPCDPQVLWLEAAKIHGPNRNKVYGMPMTSA